MIRAALISSALLAAGAAQACVIQPPECRPTTNSTAYLGGSNASVVLFYEYFDTGAERYVVTECNSRQSLAVRDPGTDDNSYWMAIDLIDRVVYDDAPQTLSEVSDAIRTITGLEAERFTLPGNHCGCNLPNIPPPASHCPTFD